MRQSRWRGQGAKWRPGGSIEEAVGENTSHKLCKKTDESDFHILTFIRSAQSQVHSLLAVIIYNSHLERVSWQPPDTAELAELEEHSATFLNDLLRFSGWTEEMFSDPAELCSTKDVGEQLLIWPNLQYTIHSTTTPLHLLSINILKHPKLQSKLKYFTGMNTSSPGPIGGVAHSKHSSLNKMYSSIFICPCFARFNWTL